jgi:predicted  nucleic acid-binding Zn-ribbon protein
LQQEIELLRAQIIQVHNIPCPICRKSKSEIALLEKQLALAASYQAKLVKAIQALREAQGHFLSLNPVSADLKKQSNGLSDKLAKAKLTDMSNKLKTFAVTYPNRLEYLMTELNESLGPQPPVSQQPDP